MLFITVLAVFHLTQQVHKNFRTKSTNIVKDCMPMFGCTPVEEVISRRKDKFLDKYIA